MRRVSKSWRDVDRQARLGDRVIHVGRIFGITVEKNHELDKDERNRKSKYRVVLHGEMFSPRIMKCYFPSRFLDVGRLPWKLAGTWIVMGAFLGTMLNKLMPSMLMSRPTSPAQKLGLPSRERPGPLPGGSIPRVFSMVTLCLRPPEVQNTTDLLADW